uniref:IPT/TIG domain-containing protein n=1 Tax=Chromera velia CCMP2878 TaxID=1169474 RepID=A0A0G4HIQ1_9ALVE|eukprot:Cvel_6970.t1-p1 / transcript=Cvel_6970.t1 / gene=Cvel_6970 / organism=Chromera_velia_CCMP2878 / gene_product=hypothetical protein / transcript_product=hypothetical protein / location=Cvel_scaffold354:772-3469(-) / protein_length=396 / sequence_SO=supercontig / SO=protein_coding / is_pseudo=false
MSSATDGDGSLPVTPSAPVTFSFFPQCLNNSDLALAPDLSEIKLLCHTDCTLSKLRELLRLRVFFSISDPSRRLNLSQIDFSFLHSSAGGETTLVPPEREKDLGVKDLPPAAANRSQSFPIVLHPLREHCLCETTLSSSSASASSSPASSTTGPSTEIPPQGILRTISATTTGAASSPGGDLSLSSRTSGIGDDFSGGISMTPNFPQNDNEEEEGQPLPNSVSLSLHPQFSHPSWCGTEGGKVVTVFSENFDFFERVCGHAPGGRARRETEAGREGDRRGGFRIPSEDATKIRVRFGRSVVPGVREGPRQIRCVAPPHGPGAVDLSVSFDSGGNWVAPSCCFTYIDRTEGVESLPVRCAQGVSQTMRWRAEEQLRWAARHHRRDRDDDGHGGAGCT